MRSSSAMLRADCLQALPASFVRNDAIRRAPKSKNRAHTGSMEIRAIWSYIDLTWHSNSVTWCAPNAFVDAAMYERGQVRRVVGLGRARADRAHRTACGAQRGWVGTRLDPAAES